MIDQLLRVQISDTTIYRVTNFYGSKACEVLENIDWGENQAEELPNDGTQIGYGSMDGAMILTKELGFKEVKLARAIRAKHIDTTNDKRNKVETSTYVAHLGCRPEFEPKVKKLFDQYLEGSNQIILINDGATWIDQLIERCFPDALSILDFYHAAEKIGEFALQNLPEQECKNWFEKHREMLLEKGGIQVYSEVEKLEMSNAKQEKNKQALLTYLNNNIHKMNYPKYIEQEHYIGSGFMESAHKFVFQHRMKQSGQRWTTEGAQRMLDLRALKCSDKWSLVIDQIKKAA